MYHKLKRKNTRQYIYIYLDIMIDVIKFFYQKIFSKGRNETDSYYMMVGNDKNLVESIKKKNKKKKNAYA